MTLTSRNRKEVTDTNKKLKSLTLPKSIANKLEEIANNTGCRQADIVKVALCELIKLEKDEQEKILIKYQLI